MRTGRHVQWQDGDTWLGYLEEFPEYLTQGEPSPNWKQACPTFTAI